MHSHLNMTQQLIAMGCGFLPMRQQPAVTHRVTYHTLHPPTVLGLVTNLHVAEIEATQDALDTGVLCHHLQTVNCQF